MRLAFASNRAELLLEGKPLLIWQVKKLRLLGIQAVLLSGKSCSEPPGTKAIPDESRPGSDTLDGALIL